MLDLVYWKTEEWRKLETGIMKYGAYSALGETEGWRCANRPK